MAKFKKQSLLLQLVQHPIGPIKFLKNSSNYTCNPIDPNSCYVRDLKISYFEKNERFI